MKKLRSQVNLPSLERKQVPNPVLQHNAYDMIGQALLTGIQKGKVSDQEIDKLLENFQADISMEFGKGYKANLGYNKPSDRGLRELFRLTLTKEF